jgi:hypothetical protein
MKNALSAALDREPVEAVNDAEFLAIVLRHQFDAIQSAALPRRIAETSYQCVLSIDGFLNPPLIQQRSNLLPDSLSVPIATQ